MWLAKYFLCKILRLVCPKMCNKILIENVLPKCMSTESITHNSAKFRNVFFSDFRYFIRSSLTLAVASRESSARHLTVAGMGVFISTNRIQDKTNIISASAKKNHRYRLPRDQATK